MRLITFRDQRGDTSTGAIVGERVIDLTQAVAALPLPLSFRALAELKQRKREVAEGKTAPRHQSRARPKNRRTLPQPRRRRAGAGGFRSAFQAKRHTR